MKIFPLLPVPYINVDFLSRRLRFDIAWNIYLGNDVCYIAVNLSQFPHNLSHHLPVRDCYNPEIASESLPHNVCYRRTKDSTVASPRELEYLKLEFMNTKLSVAESTGWDDQVGTDFIDELWSHQTLMENLRRICGRER